MSPFERLHPALQYHVVNSLGWATLRPTQIEAIEPVLAGEHVLLLAPTAGGKTEAAVLPLLSRMLTEHWSGLSVLYVCPIKALLNNLEPRLDRYLGLVGRRVGLWHGDVGPTVRRRVLAAPPDLLLITPESIEAVLTSRDPDRQELFRSLRAVVIDELHAFAGDDRGWHLRALLERLTRLTGRSLQRLGLSATVGNPEALLQWLTLGRGGRVVGSGGARAEAEVTVDYVGTLENAALVISRLHRGEKRLVFCDSRSRVETLAGAMRAAGVQVFVSHSSLSLDERRQAERAFGEATDCVIVATSTLELGIDVGDLDRVIQIDAPTSVSSFLQRMGRTGRRSGALRNCLFLATSEEALLCALGIVSLWRQGFVEEVTPPPKPHHVLAQQILAIVLQDRGASTRDLREAVHGAFPEVPAELIDETLAHLIREDLLWEDGGALWFGRGGEEELGQRSFLELLSVFTSPVQINVRYGSAELGTVDPISLRRQADKPVVLQLGGRAWHVTSVDWGRRIAWVEPSPGPGRTRWVGTARSLGFPLCQAVQGVLAGFAPGVTLSHRASAGLCAQNRDALLVINRPGPATFPARPTRFINASVDIQLWSIPSADGGSRGRSRGRCRQHAPRRMRAGGSGQRVGVLLWQGVDRQCAGRHEPTRAAQGNSLMRSGIIALRLVQAVFVLPPLVAAVASLVDGHIDRGLASLLHAGVLFVVTEAILQILLGLVEGWRRPPNPDVDETVTGGAWLRARIREDNDQSLQAFVRAMREEAAGRPTIRM